jgi:hypothetical protein
MFNAHDLMGTIKELAEIDGATLKCFHRAKAKFHRPQPARCGAVRCDADKRQRLEQLCRYITRPAWANERVQINATGQAVLNW